MPIRYKAQYIKYGVIAFAKNKLISADLLHIRKSLLKNEHICIISRFQLIFFTAVSRFNVGKFSLNTYHAVIKKGHVGTNALYV